MEGQIGELRWQYVPRPVPARFRPYVRAMVGYAEDAPGRVSRTELPYPGVVVILELDPALEVGAERFARGFLAGIGGEPSRTTYRGRQRGLQLDLSALGARALFGVDADELAGRVVPLEDLDAGELAERLADADDWAARFRVLDAFLEARLAESRVDLRLARWVLEAIEGSGGQRAIAELVDESGYSHGYLGRLCRRDLGLTPKRLSQLVRFHHLVQRLRGPGPAEPAPPPTFARLAAELGYADQSHLVREVRLFSGVAPTALAALTAPCIELEMGADRPAYDPR